MVKSAVNRRRKTHQFQEFRWAVGIEGSFIPHLKIDQYIWTQHDRYWRDDFKRVALDLGCKWLRYSIPWHLIEKHPGIFSWDWADKRLALADELGLNLMLDLVHFGTPVWLSKAFGDIDFPAALERQSNGNLRRVPTPLLDEYRRLIQAASQPVGQIAPPARTEPEPDTAPPIIVAQEPALSFPIIVHCHLRWDGVWQRPQQFLSRLSARHRVLFVEGPLLNDSNDPPRYTLHQAPDYPNVTIMQTHFPAARFKYAAWVDDERLDYELIGKIADAHPEWSIVMVGPVVKIDPDALPRRLHIYWLGRREYKDLPAYAKAFDVCLMPFGLNQATEFINPTKTLEYMATGRPIVSNPVPDVVSNFNEVVKIAPSHEDFIQLCHSAIAQPDSDAIQRGLDRARQNQWEAIVEKLEAHINDVLGRKQLLRARPAKQLSPQKGAVYV